jgi:hypothetical protein
MRRSGTDSQLVCAAPKIKIFSAAVCAQGHKTVLEIYRPSSDTNKSADSVHLAECGVLPKRLKLTNTNQ